MKTQARPTLHDGTTPALASFCSVFGCTLSKLAALARSSVLMTHGRTAPGSHENGPATSRSAWT